METKEDGPLLAGDVYTFPLLSLRRGGLVWGERYAHPLPRLLLLRLFRPYRPHTPTCTSRVLVRAAQTTSRQPPGLIHIKRPIPHPARLDVPLIILSIRIRPLLRKRQVRKVVLEDLRVQRGLCYLASDGRRRGHGIRRGGERHRVAPAAEAGERARVPTQAYDGLSVLASLTACAFGRSRAFWVG